MRLEELLSKRVIFVAGKGGVGKTTAAVLLGLFAASRRKKTLIVEFNSLGRVAPLFGAPHTPDAETPLAPYLSAVNLRPKNCFEEYVLSHVRFKAIYELFFNNRFVTNFLDAVPGLNEILLLGKVYELERKLQPKVENVPLYDLVVVDLPASGHGLSALEVPRVMLAAVSLGPMRANAEKMTRLFKDPARAALSLVTLAEEMPVAETIEFAAALRDKVGIAFGPLFINALVPPPEAVGAPRSKPAGELAHYWEYYELASNRALLNREYADKIAGALPELDRVELPFQYHGLEREKDFTPLVNLLKAGLHSG